MIQFKENVRTDRRTEGQKDRRTDKTYFIGSFRLPPGVQKIRPLFIYLPWQTTTSDHWVLRAKREYLFEILEFLSFSKGCCDWRKPIAALPWNALSEIMLSNSKNVENTFISKGSILHLFFPPVNESPTKFSKREGLTGSQSLERVPGKKGVTFSGALQFLYKKWTKIWNI